MGARADFEALSRAAVTASRAEDAPQQTENCPECGVSPGAPHHESCFFLTGDPADLRENRENER